MAEVAPPQAENKQVGEPQQVAASPKKSTTSENTNPYADINLDDLEGDDVKLTCCQSMMVWEKRPIWTPKWVLMWLGLYCVWFTTLTVMMYFTVGEVTEISVNYRNTNKCSAKVKEQLDTDVVKELKNDGKSVCHDFTMDGHPSESNAPMVEAYEIKVPKEMAKPIYMYYELSGFHQNHMRFVKSSGNFGTTQMLMTGHCMDSQKERSSERLGDSNCVAGGWGDGAQASFGYLGPVVSSVRWLLSTITMGWVSKGEWMPAHIDTNLFAMYKYWHPVSDVGLFTKGCFPWWSTKDQKCVADPREGGWLTSLNVAPHIYDLTSRKDGCYDGPEKVKCDVSQNGAPMSGTLHSTNWPDLMAGQTKIRGEAATLPISGRGDKACVGGNRVFYPCGLAAKYVFNDTFALIDGENNNIIKLDERAEKIAFDYDWMYSIRNLDPEEKFDQEKSRVGGEADLAKQLHGYRFFEVMQMWMIHRMPPTVCKNDPLRLASPNVHPDYSTGDVLHYPYAACTNYKGFSFSADKNKASCAYSPAKHTIGLYGQNTVDPSTGGSGVSGCGLDDQIPNPAGWGVENSHFLVWNRPSGLNWFKKKYANIDQKWKKDKKLTLVIANRYNLKGVTGGKDAEDDASISEGYGVPMTDFGKTDVFKRVWFQNKSWVGGRYTYIPWMFGFISLLSWIAFIIILVGHVKDPRALAKIKFMDWSSH